VEIKFEDFRVVSHDMSLSRAIADAAAIRRSAGECLKRVAPDSRIRVIGLRVNSLQRRDGTERILHEQATDPSTIEPKNTATVLVIQ
jgi:hypothetical protein